VALDDVECRRLLATPDLGRLDFTSGDLPVVHPVRFGVRNGQVVIPTRAGGQLSHAVGGAVVAFEVDCLNALAVPAGRSPRGAGARVLTDPRT
jgi:nitroimidazol reductase NimA-like FMN-containing flavoprotein (pyridoxamine 5'-phosphate oxidase superfamily)